MIIHISSAACRIDLHVGFAGKCVEREICDHGEDRGEYIHRMHHVEECGQCDGSPGVEDQNCQNEE